MNILFLGGAKRVSLAERFVKAGEVLGHNVNVFSYELNPQVPFTFVGKIIIGKKWHDPRIIEHLLQIVKEFKISFVIANVDQATPVLASLNESDPTLGLITSSVEACNIFLDKLIMHAKCEELGIPCIPLSYADFPMFLKPRHGSASQGTYLVDDNAYLAYLMERIDDNAYIRERYINGVEYSVDAYVSRNGTFVGAVPRIRSQITGGESTTATIVRDSEILELTEKITNSLELIGPITLQFMREKDRLFFMELNPRFGGGVIASIEAGFDIPRLMITDYLGMTLPLLHHYDQLIMTRYYREVFHEIDY